MPARAPRPGMGIATQQSVDNKMIYKSYLDSYVDGNHQGINQAISNFFHRDSEISIGHPINKTKGAKGYFKDFLNPLAKAFKALQVCASFCAGLQARLQAFVFKGFQAFQLELASPANRS